jgi:hypothetical protein
MKCLDKICKALKINVRVSYVDENGSSHTPKRFGEDNGEVFNLILMFDHYMPNTTFNINRIIKL